MRILSILLFLLLATTGCKKTLVQPLKEETPTEEHPKEEPTPPTPEPNPNPEPQPPKSLFKIGKVLGVRVNVCTDGTCTEIGLDVKEEAGGNPGITEEVLFQILTLKDNALVINRDLADTYLTDENIQAVKLLLLFSSTASSYNAIIGIPFALDNPDETIQDLVFKVAAEGITPAMQIGLYNGLKAQKKEIKGLNGFTKSTAINRPNPGKSIEGKYYLLLQMSLEEVKDMYDSIKGGKKVRFKISGTAKNYSEDVETIDIRLE